MKILVTGATGRLGREVTRAIRERGDQVVGVDLHDGDRRGDIRDLGQLLGVASGSDALIHCAAIPSPEMHPAEIVFATNVLGTFNALQAAELAGIRRVAIASSLSVLGGAWASPPRPPRYAPVDEAHPLEAEDSYGLSKEINERTAAMFARRSGMSVAALRFGWILSGAEARSEADLFVSDPLRNRASLWGYIDERDAAKACLAAINAPTFTFETFNIIGGDTLATIPTNEAITRYAPDVELHAPIPGFTTPFNIQRARDVLGWEPVHSWRRPSP